MLTSVDFVYETKEIKVLCPFLVFLLCEIRLLPRSNTPLF